MAPDVRGDFATGFVIFQALIIHETKRFHLRSFCSFKFSIRFRCSKVPADVPTILAACEKESQRGPRKIYQCVESVLFLCTMKSYTLPILLLFACLCLSVNAGVPGPPQSARVRIIDDSTLEVTVKPPLENISYFQISHIVLR